MKSFKFELKQIFKFKILWLMVVLLTGILLKLSWTGIAPNRPVNATGMTEYQYTSSPAFMYHMYIEAENCFSSLKSTPANIAKTEEEIAQLNPKIEIENKLLVSNQKFLLNLQDSYAYLLKKKPIIQQLQTAYTNNDSVAISKAYADVLQFQLASGTGTERPIGNSLDQKKNIGSYYRYLAENKIPEIFINNLYPPAVNQLLRMIGNQ